MNKIEELPTEITSTEDSETQLPEGSEVTLLSKNEKKARKLFAKLGMKKVNSINRIVLRRSDNVHFVVSQPEVFRAGSTYIVFGVIKVEDYRKIMQQAEAMQRQQEETGESTEYDAEGTGSGIKSGDMSDASVEELNSAGISNQDISMIKDQIPSATNNQILKAYNENNKDVVNTVIALSS